MFVLGLRVKVGLLGMGLVLWLEFGLGYEGVKIFMKCSYSEEKPLSIRVFNFAFFFEYPTLSKSCRTKIF